MNLRSKLIRLAHQRPELRAELLPLLGKVAVGGGPKLDRAVVAEAADMIKKLRALQAEMAAFYKLLDKAQGEAELEYNKQRAVLDEDSDLLYAYQQVSNTTETLMKIVGDSSPQSIVKRLDYSADDLERELRYTPRNILP